MVISAPDPKTFVIARNVTMSVSGNNVAVTWRTNETGQGPYFPVIRTITGKSRTAGTTLNMAM